MKYLFIYLFNEIQPLSGLKGLTSVKIEKTA